MRRLLAALAFSATLGLVLVSMPASAPAQRPPVVGSAVSIYNASVGSAWTQVARAALDDITIGPYSVGSTDVFSCVRVEMTHATQTLRVRFSHNVAAGATEGELVPAGIGGFRFWCLYGLNVSEISLYGSGAATTAGGAVAICGASAAVAIAAVVSEKRMRPQFLLFVVIGVTAMSTLASGKGRRSTSPTTKSHVTPAVLASARAMSIAVGAMSMPIPSAPARDASMTNSPPPHPR